LLTGELESTNECYALAKIAGIRLAQAYQKQYGDRFICAMPTNLYGPGDHYDLENSHVLPGVMRRIHEAVGAESVTLWGSGQPGREFLFVDDLAEACLFLMENYEAPDLVNVGTGDAIPLWRLAEFIANKVGFTGLVKWDTSKPDGTPWRCLDVTKINKLGWTARTKLWEGLGWTYDDYIKRIPHE
jgi:GDP-L-fucose synthase